MGLDVVLFVLLEFMVAVLMVWMILICMVLEVYWVIQVDVVMDDVMVWLLIWVGIQLVLCVWWLGMI